MDVAKAVASAHALDLLHKDLKPANILVASTSDGTPQIKIADFGSASLLVPARLTALGITNLGFTQTTGKEAGALTGTLMYSLLRSSPGSRQRPFPTCTHSVCCSTSLWRPISASRSRRDGRPTSPTR